MAKGKFRNYNFPNRRDNVTPEEPKTEIEEVNLTETTSETDEVSTTEEVTEISEVVNETASVIEVSATTEPELEPVSVVTEPVTTETETVTTVIEPVALTIEPAVRVTSEKKHAPHLSALLKGLKMKLAGIIEHTGVGKPEEPNAGAARRYSVYKHVKEILNIEDPVEFKKQMNTFHNLIKEGYDNVFNEKNLFKFPNEWPGTSSEFQEYRKLLQLLIETRTQEGFKHFSERLDIDKFGLKLNKKERNNLVSYLGR